MAVVWDRITSHLMLKSTLAPILQIESISSSPGISNYPQQESPQPDIMVQAHVLCRHENQGPPLGEVIEL